MIFAHFGKRIQIFVRKDAVVNNKHRSYTDAIQKVLLSQVVSRCPSFCDGTNGGLCSSKAFKYTNVIRAWISDLNYSINELMVRQRIYSLK